MKSNISGFIIGLSITTIFGLSGCGGGGGNDGGSVAPVASSETFQLKTAYINTLTTSSSKPFTISGTSSGVSATGSGTSIDSSLSSAIFEGSDCNKQVTTVSGTISGNGTSVPYGSTLTSYYDANYNYLGSSGTYYTVTSGTMSLPLTARVNDTDVVFTEIIYPSSAKAYSTGTYTHSFSLEPDTATTALLKLITTEKNTSNTVISTSISTMRLSPSGSITKLSETYVTSTDNLRITY